MQAGSSSRCTAMPICTATISFTSQVAIRTFASVHRLVLSLLFLASVVPAPAQVQEKKLLDRLLKPDMTLQNNMQGKQFAAPGATLTKNAPTKSFYVKERKLYKAFWDTRQASQKRFQTQRSRFAHQEANLSTRGQLAKLEAPYPTGAFRSAHQSSDAEKALPVSEFPGNRKFEAQGKSQKFLNTQDRPMTINEVRELLNKNK